jgi:hypothetical protein
MLRRPLTRIACGDPTSPRKRGEVNPLKLVRKTSESRHSASARSSNAPSVCWESRYFPRTALPHKGEGFRAATAQIANAARSAFRFLHMRLPSPLWGLPCPAGGGIYFRQYSTRKCSKSYFIMYNTSAEKHLQKMCRTRLSGGVTVPNEVARALRKRLTPQEVKLWVKLRELKCFGYQGPSVLEFGY